MDYIDIGALQSLARPWIIFLAESPVLRAVQFCMLLLGLLVIFLVFFTTRDILIRTHSFWYMLFSIVLVAFIPIAGFFLYLLIRPVRTIKEREMETLLIELLANAKSSDRRKSGDAVGGIVRSKPKKKSAAAASKENISL